MLQNEAVHREVRDKLKNSTVGKGKCLASDIPELGSREGDRLEPSATMMDTARFHDQSAFTVVVLFWRPPLQPTVQRRHPILNVAFVTGVETFSLDILHTLHFGGVSILDSPRSLAVRAERGQQRWLDWSIANATV